MQSVSLAHILQVFWPTLQYNSSVRLYNILATVTVPDRASRDDSDLQEWSLRETVPNLNVNAHRYRTR